MTTELHGLYAITPDQADGNKLLADVEAVLAGGCRILQYRDKISAMPEQLQRARALLALTRRFAAKLIINDDLALARLIDADGLHLGKEDGHLKAARAILGPGKWLGASCYADFGLAERAAAAGADYIAFGAVYPSSTKPDAVRAPVDLFSRAKTTLTVPSAAIGGITLDNARPIIAAGADMLAVITDLFGASDIAARANAYQSLFQESST